MPPGTQVNRGHQRSQSHIRKADMPTVPETTNTTNDTTRDTPTTTLLKLIGYTETDQVVLSTSNGDNQMRSHQTKNLQEANNITGNKTTESLWFNVNKMRELQQNKRGSIEDVTQLTALYADLDIAENKIPTQEAAENIINDLSQALGTPPAAIVGTGGGLHPYWPITEGTNTKSAATLLKRWRVLVEDTARDHGGTTDNVFDLTRMLRAPGTHNHKYNPPIKTTLTEEEPDGWESLTLDDAHDRLTDIGIPTPANNQALQHDPNSTPVGTLAHLPDGEPCGHFNNMQNTWNRQLQEEGTVHATVTRITTWITQQGREGCPGARKALQQAQQCFYNATPQRSSEYSQQQLDQEWRNQLQGALRNATSKPQAPTGCTDTQRANEANEAIEAILGDNPELNHPWTDQRLFESSELLKYSHQLAEALLLDPLAVYITYLARFRAEVCPYYVIPDFIGSEQTLNMGVALVAGSGGGKTSINGATRSRPPAAQYGPPNWVAQQVNDPASAAAMQTTFMTSKMEQIPGSKDKMKVPVQHKVHGYFYIDEIKSLEASARGTDNSMTAAIRSATSGSGAFGKRTAGDRNANTVPDYAASLSVTVAAQPENLGWLLEESGSGTPQRFVFIDIRNHDPQPFNPNNLTKAETIAAHKEQRSKADQFTTPPISHLFLCTDGHCTGQVGSSHIPITLTEEAEYTSLKINHNRRDEIESHSNLMRIKLAALAAMTRGQLSFTDEDWAAAGEIMRRSRQTIDACRQVVTSKKRDSHKATGVAAGMASEAQAEYEADKLRERGVARIRRYAEKHEAAGTTSTRRALKDSLARDKKHMNDWLKAAAAEGVLIPGITLNQ